MSEKYALVEHSSVINSIISNTFQTTHRIKFTAFDVSSKYIVFGANSGGIYIFARKPCQFLKLIPSTHGPTVLIHISGNQENLAIATSTGLVILLEGCFSPHFESQVFTEHEGHNVTALKWSGDDLYCGDSKGLVSVMTLKNFLTVFQNPAASLMNLDSQIVQLDTYTKFLLVSTQTRSVLCDTETQQYRQVGKKMRDGLFGACFSANQIYCARPGARLWQADFQGNVLVTHQFRASLGQKHSDIIHWDDSDELNVKTYEEECPGDFTFTKIFSFLDKFILTFREEGFYIFEPSERGLVHFSTHISGIQDIKIVDSFLYIWHDDLGVSVLSLMEVEELVLRSLVRKKFELCSRLCIKYYDDVVSLIDTSKKIHLISALEAKIEAPDVLEKLIPIFQRLKEHANAPILQTFKNGIVTVNALPMLPESVQNFEPIDNFEQIKDNLEQEKKDTTTSILKKQFITSKINDSTETNDFVALVESLDPADFHKLLTTFQESQEDCESWCQNKFLKYLKSVDLSQPVLDYSCRAFLQINLREDLSCKCDFPLPEAHKVTPKYFEIGAKLMEKSDSYDIFLKKVPSMHRFVLNDLGSEDFQIKIPLLIQFGDPKIIALHSEKFTLDSWDDSVRLLLKLKSGQCLNCGAVINSDCSLSWNAFGLLMVRSIQARNTIKLLKRYSKLIPKGELDQNFYQYCIFSSVTPKSQTLNDSVEDPKVQKEFESSVGGFLRQKYLHGGDYYDPPSHKSIDNCDHCQMPLKIPVLEAKKLACGHSYHVVCLLHNDGKCFICKAVL